VQTAVVARRGNLKEWVRTEGGGGKWFATLIADERDVAARHGTQIIALGLKSEIDVISDMAMSHDRHDTTGREIVQ